MKYLHLAAYIGMFFLMLAVPMPYPLLTLIKTMSVSEFIYRFEVGVGYIGYTIYLLIMLPTFHLCMRHLLKPFLQAKGSRFTLEQHLLQNTDSIKQ